MSYCVLFATKIRVGIKYTYSYFNTQLKSSKLSDSLIKKLSMEDLKNIMHKQAEGNEEPYEKDSNSE